VMSDPGQIKIRCSHVRKSQVKSGESQVRLGQDHVTSGQFKIR